jgi:hypothetical protein
MINFNFDSNTKEFLNSRFPIEIISDVSITETEVGVTDKGLAFLDITFEHPKGYRHRERIFDPTNNVPHWTTPEKEVEKTKARLKHIIGRFVPEEEQVFSATSFSEMCKQIAGLLTTHAIETNKKVTAKFVYDRNYQFPEFPRGGAFLAAEGEDALEYTPREIEKNFPEQLEKDVEDTSSEESTLF